MRCELGTILRAAPGLRPQFNEAFLIVDERLRLQAVSRRAEHVLMLSEPRVVDRPLEEFLTPIANGRDGSDLAALVEQAVAGARAASRTEVRSVHDARVAFTVRVAACGPPRAAVLVLTPAAPRKLGSEAGKGSGSQNGLPPSTGRGDGAT
jgi:nitrogen-specific signal transduction histidine kinase